MKNNSSQNTANCKVPLKLFNVDDIKNLTNISIGTIIETVCFNNYDDNGHARYIIASQPNGIFPESIEIDEDIYANMIPPIAINYDMFGAIGDGINNDGHQIKLAHDFANKYKIPVEINNGNYYIKGTTNISVQTNTSFGHSNIYIDEEMILSREQAFKIESSIPNYKLPLDKIDTLKGKIKKGYNTIPELSPYNDSIAIIKNLNKNVMLRYGKHTPIIQEDIIYIDERGTIASDIVEDFYDISSIEIHPCENHYLTVQGGNFSISGNGKLPRNDNYIGGVFEVSRSRTIIQNQIYKLPDNTRDKILAGSDGFFFLNKCCDITLQNIRVFPREKSRKKGDTLAQVPVGSYGIGGEYVIGLKMYNIHADNDEIGWGIMGMNYTKEITIKDSVLNRVDVHYSGNNILVENTTIGRFGVSVHGSGYLKIQNCRFKSNRFVSLRSDYGSHWNGHIIIENCIMTPISLKKIINVIEIRTKNFDFLTDVVHGKRISLNNIIFDFTHCPENNSQICVLDFGKMNPSISRKTFFPHHIVMDSLYVEGRLKGMKLLNISNPDKYYMPHEYRIEKGNVKTNAKFIAKNCDIINEEVTTIRNQATATIYISQKYSDCLNNNHGWAPEIILENLKGLNIQTQYLPANIIVNNCEVRHLDFFKEQSAPVKIVFNFCKFNTNYKIFGNYKPYYFIFKNSFIPIFNNCEFTAPMNKADFIKNDNYEPYHPIFDFSNKTIKGYFTGCRCTPDFINFLTKYTDIKTQEFEEILMKGGLFKTKTSITK